MRYPPIPLVPVGRVGVRRGKGGGRSHYNKISFILKLSLKENMYYVLN
jgi:hypothetical protein